MGATESKLAFRKNVFALYEQRNLNAADDAFWSKFYELPENPEDVFNLFSLKDIRRVRDSAPENLETLISKFRLTLADVVSENPGIRFVIWEKGVGTSNAPPTSAALASNRIEILRFLLTMLSSTMYSTTAEVLKKTNKWAIVIATGLDKKTVLTLLCSLLNTSLSYDPIGWGLIPYNHVSWPALLVSILDLGSGVQIQKRPSIIPNVALSPTSPDPNQAFPEAREEDQIAATGNNEFRFYLAKLHRPEDFIFIMEGFERLLKNPMDASNTYLPGSTKKITLHVELVMLFWKFYEVNESIHMLITTTGKSPISSLHENFLICLSNVSPFIKSLTVVTSNKLLNLFNSFSNPGFMLATETNHKLVFYLLDIFNNIVQYQITGNSHLVYAIVRARQRFYDLNEITFATASVELNRLRSVKAERLKKLEKVGLRPSPTDPNDLKPIDSEPKSHASEEGEEDETEVGSSEAAKEPTSPKGELSEKAKGKLPMSQVSGETKMKFEPTEEWFVHWKSHLRLSVLITLVDALGPPIEALCVEKGFNDDRRVIEYLQSGTLVGLLPLPHPLFIRRFTYSEPVRVWFTSYMWGHIFVKNTNTTGSADVIKLSPPIWTGTKLGLFNVRTTA
ncbi:hypothetical protein HDU67_009265 [Dinochytrium kinnereticum]|nr:hypothetical protein HDU67_009265 [Dinochytrium kinnereticum]